MLPIPKSDAVGFDINADDLKIMDGIIDGTYGIITLNFL